MGGALYLEPRLGPGLRSLLESDRLPHTLVDALGSPLGVVLPEQLADNVERFRSVYRGHHLAGQIFLAHKANRSSALLRRLAATGAGVDVASLGELRHALGCGFTPSLITATGPKEPRFLWLAARTGATVSLDSPAELDQLAARARAHRLPRVRVLLRLSGFEASGVKVLTRRSRFGTPVAELDAVLDAVKRYDDAVELTGVAYHLDTTSPDEKAIALEGCLLALEECRAGPTGGAAYVGAVRHLRAYDETTCDERPGGRRTAVFIVCDRVESYLSYVRQRRPELLGRARRKYSAADLSEADVRAAPRIAVPDARARIDREGPLVVDLRSPYAYAALHIDGSVNIVDELFEELVHGGLPFSRSRPVLLACPVGEKSARYAALLTRMGHPDVRSLEGGIIAWRDAGAPLVRD